MTTWRDSHDAAIADADSDSSNRSDSGATWRGLGFEVAGTRLVVSLAQVGELVACGQVTPVPLTKSWVKGIANVRGRLLTVCDLSAYLGYAPLPVTPSSRVIVINTEAFQCALLVSKVYGLSHFDVEQQRPDMSSLDVCVQPYVDRVFAQEDTVWGVFNIDRLLQDDDFKQAGIDCV